MYAMRLVLASAAVTLAMAVPPAAAAGGNAANAKLCQQGGWTNLVRADGTAFKNQGACVSYGGQGGTPRPTFAVSRQACVGIGGTFTPGGPDLSGFGKEPTLWTCNAFSEVAGNVHLMFDRCQADGGDTVAIRTVSGVVEAFTCAP